VDEITIFFLFILALVILIVYGIRRLGNVDTAIAVDDSPSEAVEAVVSYMVQQGFAISHRDATSATFTRRKPANTDIGCLLLLLGIVPGLLYFGLFKGTWTTTVFATTGPAGTQLMISGDDRKARTNLHWWARTAMGTDETSVSLEKPEREDEVLASVRGVVDLSPHEALDEAQEFLTRQGYSVTYRTTTTLTVERQVSDNASGQESIFKLIVMALPQSGGGVRIKVRGDDREAVRDHQAAWLEWSETLPKRETEQPEAAATMESVTREIVGQEAPRPTTAAANNAPQSRYCSNCGHQLAENDRFCTNCGTPVH
jgi:hypothetical protein